MTSPSLPLLSSILPRVVLVGCKIMEDLGFGVDIDVRRTNA